MNCSTKNYLLAVYECSSVCNMGTGMLSLCKYGQCFVWEGIQMGLETNLMESCQPAFG